MNFKIEEKVLPSLKHPKDALRLLHHPHNELMTSDGQGHHFFDPQLQKTKRPRGLTPVMAEVFWPESLTQPFKKSRRGTGTRARRGPAATIHEAARGMLKGNIVHEQIEELFTLDAASFNRRHKEGADPWSFNTVVQLFGGRIKPLASELGVASVEDARVRAMPVERRPLILDVATRIDMIGAEQSGKILFFELKTGYETVKEWAGTGLWMHGPLRGVMRDSPMHRAIVQIVLGALIAVKSRELQGAFECWVVHVHSTGTEFLQVKPEFIRKYGEAMYEAVWWHQQRRKGAGKRTVALL